MNARRGSLVKLGSSAFGEDNTLCRGTSTVCLSVCLRRQQRQQRTRSRLYCTVLTRLGAARMSSVSDVLTYSGSETDIIINYVTFSVVCVPFILVALHPFQLAKGKIQLHIWSSLLFFMLFQVILCVIVGCVGISIIWCAMLGFMTADYFFFRFDRDGPHDGSAAGDALIWRCRSMTSFWSFVVSALLGFSVFLYYAATADALTSIAHVLAFFALGLGSGILKYRFWSGTGEWYPCACGKGSNRSDAQPPLPVNSVCYQSAEEAALSQEASTSTAPKYVVECARSVIS